MIRRIVAVIFVIFVCFSYSSKSLAGTNPKKVKWGVLIYMNAKNILGQKRIDIKTIAKIYRSSKENGAAAVAIDYIGINGSKYILIKNGRKTVYTGLSSDIDKFISWSDKKIHSDKKMFVLWGTGGTFYFGNIKKKAVSYRYLADKIKQGIGGAGRKMDIVLIDACRGYSIESIYNLSKIANYLVASDLVVPLNGFPYGKIFNILKQNANTAKVGKLIASEYIKRYSKAKQTVNCVVLNLQKSAPFIKELVKTLCVKGKPFFRAVVLSSVQYNLKKEIPKEETDLPLYIRIGDYHNFLSYIFYKGDESGFIKSINGLKHSIVWYGCNATAHCPLKTPFIWIPSKHFFTLKKSDDVLRIYTDNFGKNKCNIVSFIKQAYKQN